MDNNILLVDPNGDNKRSNRPLEDLSIYVKLRVLARNDDMILFDNTDSSSPTLKSVSNNLTTISFIDSGLDETKKTYLTTNYTELKSGFNENNPDLETLGIVTIDISFNASLVPVVKIRFKDVRGRLFEMGNDSPYSFMFRMPYPIFYLTIKGYYGNPVEYALHMTEFSGNLDNETGSFIINCNFIGYTYAFLADILMSYIKAVPYTANGSKLIINNPDYISFFELRRTIKTLQKSVDKYKSEDKINRLLDMYNKANVKVI